MQRRDFLGSGLGGLALLPLAGRGLATSPFDPVARLQPIRATPDRLFRITVCLRPFRAAGPRVEGEQVGRKRIIHNYGHGGSGWSLSWGSAQEAVALALADGVRQVAVVGAGALGLTAALTAQRAGAAVTIYAKEQFPYVRSAWATGSWTPDSRVAMKKAAGPAFPDRWERMARAAFTMHQSYLGLPGDPVEWTDRYALSDTPYGRHAKPGAEPERPDDFLRLEERLRDITPRSVELAPGTHPFRAPFVRRNSGLTFNVADLAHQLVNDFRIAGGKIVPMEFHEPGELAHLKEKVVINCTGYGARALWKDESIVPVRGQIAWLIPQADVTYGAYYGTLSMIARRDGIVVQETGRDEWFGYGDDNEAPDRAAAEASVRQLATWWVPPPA